MSAHTPGEWKVGDDEPFVYAMHDGGCNRFFAAVNAGEEYRRGPRTGHDELMANARLIAAAPDLYEALNGMVGLCALLLINDLPTHVRATLEGNHRVVAAREALAKAEGK